MTTAPRPIPPGARRIIALSRPTDSFSTNSISTVSTSILFPISALDLSSAHAPTSTLASADEEISDHITSDSALPTAIDRPATPSTVATASDFDGLDSPSTPTRQKTRARFSAFLRRARSSIGHALRRRSSGLTAENFAEGNVEGEGRGVGAAVRKAVKGFKKIFRRR